jgi:hypothetical protein
LFCKTFAWLAFQLLLQQNAQNELSSLNKNNNDEVGRYLKNIPKTKLTSTYLFFCRLLNKIDGSLLAFAIPRLPSFSSLTFLLLNVFGRFLGKGSSKTPEAYVCKSLGKTID